jgi:hypothetical protein
MHNSRGGRGVRARASIESGELFSDKAEEVRRATKKKFSAKDA